MDVQDTKTLMRGIEPVHFLEFRAVDTLLSSLTGQALLLRLQVAKERPLDASRDHRRRECSQL
jgi:hypothetical protein